MSRKISALCKIIAFPTKMRARKSNCGLFRLCIFYSDILRSILFCAELALNKLDKLNYGDDGYTESESYEIFNDTDRGKAECSCNEGYLANESRQKKRAARSKVKELIMRAEGEYALLCRAHIDAMEYLSH